MIISCNKCNKKFDINSNLIPDGGRLLQCSSCKNQWFFKKEKKIDLPLSDFIEKKHDSDLKEDVLTASVVKKSIKEIDKNKIKISNDNEDYVYKEKRKIKNITKKSNILNSILVFIISVVALIIIIDTFKSPISIFIPNIEYIMYNLFESLKDIILFFKDLM